MTRAPQTETDPDADQARFERLAALHADAFTPHERGWSAREIRSLSGTGLLIAATDDSGFALISIAADESELLTIAVADPARDRGMGGALLDQSMKAAAGSGAARMFLEVAEDNHHALALYQRRGFSETARRKAYYRRGETRIDALLLSREL